MRLKEIFGCLWMIIASALVCSAWGVYAHSASIAKLVARREGKGREMRNVEIGIALIGASKMNIQSAPAGKRNTCVLPNPQRSAYHSAAV